MPETAPTPDACGTFAEVGTAPLFLWFLNHELTPEELRRQVGEFKAKGWGGFFMHWISGGEPYMGRRWLDALDVIIEAASEQGMEAWLYDEGWCPSGFAGGRVLAQAPELQMHTLWHATRDVAQGREVVLDFDLMQVLTVVAMPLADGIPQPELVVDLQEELGPVQVDQAPPYRHDWGYYPHGEPILLHWRQSAKRRVWRLRWTPPDQRTWRVHVICARGVLQWDQTDHIDVLNPRAFEAFLKETHEVYARRFAHHFGRTVPGIMTDEAKFLHMPWTARLPEVYEQRFGRALMADLPALFDPHIPECRLARGRYHRLVSDLFRESFVEPMGAWCRQHGLRLTGHISPEEDVTYETDYTGSIARALESFDAPGTDLIIQAVGDAERPGLNLGPRLASSVARQHGRSRVFVEVGACCEEEVSLEELKHMCDWLMVNGINLIALHGMNYTSQGFRKFYVGQTYSYQANLWENAHLLTAYLEQRSRELTRFAPHRRVAVLKPHTAVRALTPPTEGSPDREAVDEALVAVLWALLERHCDFDLLDEDTAGAWSAGAALDYAIAAYDLVVVPPCDWIDETAARKLGEWAERGGQVICVGHTPRILGPECEAEWEAPVQVCHDVGDAAERVEALVPADVQIAGSQAGHVLASYRTDIDGQCCAFLVNLLAETVTLDVAAPCFRGPVTLAPWESRLLPQEATAGAPVTGEVADSVGVLGGPWTIRAERRNHIPLVETRTRLTVEPGAQVEILVLDPEEALAVAASLKLDGEPVPCEHTRPEPFYDAFNAALPIGERLGVGEHELELDTADAPTVLVAGRFAALRNGEGWRLTAEPDTAQAVDRVSAGYPYLRGALRFTTSFAIETPLAHAGLELPGRRGCISAAIDGTDVGSVAWHPDALLVGEIAAGEHTLELAVIGDGIGILRGAPNPAGVSSPPILRQIP